MLYLESVELCNFRRFKSKTINFSSNINILIGENATGKTSILEAINMLGVCKSFKTNKDVNLIHNELGFFYVKGFLKGKEGNNEVVVSFTEKGKKVVLNGKIYPKISLYLGFLNVVSFIPNDIRIVTGESKYKRDFINLYLGMIDKNYLNDIIEYEKILKERNNILKNFEMFNKNYTFLRLYTQKMIEVSKKIIKKREKFIEKLEENTKKYVLEISNKKENVKIEYIKNIDCGNIEKTFLENEEREIISGTTLYGPHKDKYNIYINDWDVISYCSQGQQKTIALSMKLGIVDMINAVKENIILILDDVFGELDKKRQEKIIENLKIKGQIFISTTDLTLIDKNLLENSNIIELN